ncbi:uncharacterized protein LOC125490951 [Plutella xylostella]|uniref:uncharacterized protein LOC125490951 n=1 Tax=Plutella xylostella TaxID=51655 RepID=UPI002032587B|nr:uncharacterized protein LOC125490951 [Plutella xylostella]
MDFSCCQSTENTGVVLDCTQCRGKFHGQCVLSNFDNKSLDSDALAAWLCPNCVRKEPKRDNTPIRTGNNNNNSRPCKPEAAKVNKGVKTRSQLQKPEASGTQPTATPAADLRGIIREELTKFRSEMTSMINTAITSALATFKQEVDDLKASINIISDDYAKLKSSIQNMESKAKVHEKKISVLDTLQHQTDILIKQDNENQQWSRRSNIEIFGIPERKDENLLSVVQDLANRVDFPLDINRDVDFVTRVASSDKDNKKPKPIVLRLLARYKKDDFLAKLKKLKGLKGSDIGYTGNSGLIFFNDHLTKSNKSLLYMAKKRARELNYKYIYVKNCSIRVRFSDTSPVIVINSEVDLNKIK